MDPANKSLRFRGFQGDSLPERVACVEKCLGDIGLTAFLIEHVYKGPPGQRSLTDMCVVELRADAIREDALKHLNKKRFPTKPTAS